MLKFVESIYIPELKDVILLWDLGAGIWAYGREYDPSKSAKFWVNMGTKRDISQKWENLKRNSNQF